MYPLTIIIAMGIARKDRHFPAYVLPLGVAGLAVAAYHNLLYYGFIPESAAPCAEGVSCTTQQIEWLGFITIPLLSLVAFLVITICMLVYRSMQRYELRS
jgi:disulfide bond formation protein DsbB